MRGNLEDSQLKNTRNYSGKWGTARRLVDIVYYIKEDDAISHFLYGDDETRYVRLPEPRDGQYHLIANISPVFDIQVQLVDETNLVLIGPNQAVLLCSSPLEWVVLGTPYEVFGPSGTQHSIGLVPDPGPVEGAARFLREDGEWAETGVTGVEDSFKTVTDGTNSALATGADTLKVRSSDSSVSVVVTNNDGVHGDNINFTVNEATVNHNTLQNYVASQHVDHNGVNIATPANSGLAGGGTIAASRTLTLDLGNLAVVAPALNAGIPFYDMSGSVTRIALVSTFNTLLVHNSLSGYVANEHVNHSTLAISAGTGLSGGGNLTASQTLSLAIHTLPLESLASGDLFAFYDISGGDHNSISMSGIVSFVISNLGTMALVNSPVPIANGGTGATSQSAARTALGLGTAATQNTGTSGANVPLLNGGNTWSGTNEFGAAITVKYAFPRYVWYDTGGAVNEKRWDAFVLGNQLIYRIVNDADSAANAWLTVTRSTHLSAIAEFTSSPLVPTPSAADDTQKAAPTAWVNDAIAAITSPTTIATPPDGDDDLSIANTAFVQGSYRGKFANVIFLGEYGGLVADDSTPSVASNNVAQFNSLVAGLTRKKLILPAGRIFANSTMTMPATSSYVQLDGQGKYATSIERVSTFTGGNLFELLAPRCRIQNFGFAHNAEATSGCDLFFFAYSSEVFDIDFRDYFLAIDLAGPQDAKMGNLTGKTGQYFTDVDAVSGLPTYKSNTAHMRVRNYLGSTPNVSVAGFSFSQEGTPYPSAGWDALSPMQNGILIQCVDYLKFSGATHCGGARESQLGILPENGPGQSGVQGVYFDNFWGDFDSDHNIRVDNGLGADVTAIHINNLMLQNAAHSNVRIDCNALYDMSLGKGRITGSGGRSSPPAPSAESVECNIEVLAGSDIRVTDLRMQTAAVASVVVASGVNDFRISGCNTNAPMSDAGTGTRAWGNKGITDV